MIPCHDFTLSVGEPDNAAAKLRSEQTVTPLHEQSPATYFLRLNNLETFVELVGARPLHLLSQTVLPLKSPTGAFIATQTRSRRKVQNGEGLFPMKIFTAPQHTRSILPPIHPTKSIAALRGRYFSFSQIKSYVVVQSSKICFWLLTAQPQSVILVLERSRL